MTTRPRGKRPKANVATWLAWLKAIESDIYLIHVDRLHWRELVKIVRANPNIPSPGYVMDWVTRMYISHVLSGIRRQLEVSPEVVSLGKLLDSISNNPGLLTRDDFVRASCASDLTDEFEVRSALSHFKTYAAPRALHIDPARVRADLELLRAKVANVKAYADDRIAHMSKAHADSAELEKLAVPTFNELDAAIDLLGSLLQKYYRLLTGTSLGSAEPVPQYNWTLPFTVAWMLPNQDLAD